MRKVARALIFLGWTLSNLAAGADGPPSSVVHLVKGDGVLDGLGGSVTGLGDVDGDGVPDFAAGAVQSFNNPEAKGYVRVYSGKTGETIRTWRGERMGEQFGRLIRPFPDMDGDGVGEIGIQRGGGDVIGSFIEFYSPVTGNLLRVFQAPAPPGFYPLVTGFRACRDADGDGVFDLLIGETAHSIGEGRDGFDVGRVRLYSGPTFEFVWERIGTVSRGILGFDPTDLGDVDGDSLSDIAVGEPRGVGHNSVHRTGIVYILRGFDGKELHRLDPGGDYFFFGVSLVNLGDLDGDGHADLGVGAPGYSTEFRRDFGWFGAYSTRDFRLLWSATGNNGHVGGLFFGDAYGFRASSAGDADGDGTPDVLVSTNRFSSASGFGPGSTGQVDLRSGKTGRMLQVFHGAQRNRVFVTDLAPLGDVDGDGRSEFLVGADEAPNKIFDDRGEVRVVRVAPERPLFLRGDANRDGVVDISDAVALVGIVNWREDPGPCPLALDSSGDDDVDFLDILTVLEYLFGGYFAPMSPFPDCARHEDLTYLGRLECRESTCSE